MELQEILNAIYRIPEASADRLASCSVRIDRPKGCRILEAGKVETDLFFIARGIARAYIPTGDREITFWIGQEGTAIVSLRSYVCNGAGYESVELMEDSSLYRLRRNDLDTLYREDIHIANWGRKFAESEFLRTEERLIPPAFYDGLGTLRTAADTASRPVAAHAAGVPGYLFGRHSRQSEPHPGETEIKTKSGHPSPGIRLYRTPSPNYSFTGVTLT